MSDSALTYRIAFSMTKGLTPTLAGELLARIGSESAFFSYSSSQLSALIGRRMHIFDDKYRADLLTKATSEIAFMENHGIKFLYYSDDNYPQRLLECQDAPMALYTMGKCDLNDTCFVGIVGTRHATPYGINFVNKLVEEMALKLEHTPVIVSGLAQGIDVTAHKAAIKAGVPTVAVLAHGLNTLYPADHRRIAADIGKRSGALVTEYPSCSRLHRGNFLARNRIIAGLCDCVIVAESAAKGGALVTARCAQSYNRDIFALPGRTSDPYSAGCNKLIAKNMAALVSDVDSVIAAMGWPCRYAEGEQQKLAVELGPDEQEILDYLTDHSDVRLNALSIALGRPVGKLMSALVDLEFKNLVIAYPGGLYRLA